MKTFLILLILLTLFSLNTFAQDVPNAVLSEHTGDVHNVVFSPDGTTLASRSADNTIRLWDVATGTPKYTLISWVTVRRTDRWGNLVETAASIHSIAFSPDGQTLVGVAGRTIRLWNVATGTTKYTLIEHTADVNSVVFSPDGTTLASGSADGTIRLWDAATGKRKAKITVIGSNIYGVVFSPDGTTLASRSDDNTIRLWDIATGALKHLLTAHTDNVYTIAFHPDGNTIASGGRDNTVHLWDVATGTVNHTLTAHTADVNSVVFSPDGQTLASRSEDETIRIWDVATGTVQHTLREHRRYISSIAFSPNGQTLASASEDDTIRLWDVATGKHLGTLTEHWDNVNTLAFSPDGKTLASGSDDNTIRLWRFTTTHIGITPNPVVSPIIGEEFSINVSITEAETVGGYQLTLGFEPTALSYVSSANGNYLTEGSYFVQPIVENNSVTLGATNYAKVSNGAGILATITFEVVDVKESTLNLSGVILTDSDGNRLSHLVGGGKIVEPPPVPSTSVVSVTPSAVLSPARHQQFTLNIDIVGGQNVAAHRLFWEFDDGPLELLSGKPGDYLADRIGNGDGTLFTGIFKVRSVKTSTVSVSGHLIGTDGLRYIPTFESTTVVEPIFGDVNRDGVVDIRDLVLVASSFNQEVPEEGNPADVTENDLVNIIDLVKVAGVIGGGAAAPSVLSNALNAAPTRSEVQKWLSQAQQLNLTEATSQRGILFLQQLLAALTPKETALLPNYPNPFNPETWIPYQLSHPAEVSISIYAADGKLVQILSLGQQSIGTYQDKSRAAYWDGRNVQGESVASGVYFYMLKAGDFTATRKMLIRK